MNNSLLFLICNLRLPVLSFMTMNGQIVYYQLDLTHLVYYYDLDGAMNHHLAYLFALPCVNYEDSKLYSSKKYSKKVSSKVAMLPERTSAELADRTWRGH